MEILAPHTPIRQPGKLTRLGDVRKEMARVYRAACRGEIDFADASKATFMLSQIGKLIQEEAIQAKAAALENGGFENQAAATKAAREKFVSQLASLTRSDFSLESKS